jgi:Zn-finger nucleic acid-binding protein
MKCPVCQTTDLLITTREGVEIDYCPQCRGVWLDRGELDKIIDRTLVERDDDRDDDRRTREDDWEYKRDRSHKPRKRRSFLSDLFEFD